jgi:hypothetical protein
MGGAGSRGRRGAGGVWEARGGERSSFKQTIMKKFLRIFVVVVALGLVLFFFFHYYFVFGRGVKAGVLNYVVEKGYIFKTYEGELIQTGIKSLAPNSMQSNEFTFSIADAVVAKKLMLSSGKEVQLHYEEYKGTVPWRGYSEFVVDSIISISEPGK